VANSLVGARCPLLGRSRSRTVAGNAWPYGHCSRLSAFLASGIGAGKESQTWTRAACRKSAIGFATPVTNAGCPICPDILRRPVALIHSVRLSLMKGAHAGLSSEAWQEIGVKPSFGLSGIMAPDRPLPVCNDRQWKCGPTLCHSAIPGRYFPATHNHWNAPSTPGRSIAGP
jgi:hypothetical protein